MKAGLKVLGVGAVKATLRNMGDRVVSTARGQMNRAADRVVKTAKIMVPEEDQLLKESIEARKSYEFRGRLVIEVTAGGGIVLGPDGEVNLDQYASIIHENYEDIISSSPTDERGRERRARTKRKQAAHPEVYVGGKFIERALEKEREGLESRMVGAITEIVE